jgi:hypothetical protein
MRVPLIGAVALVGIAFAATPPSVSAAPLGGISKNPVLQAQSSDFSAQQKPKKAGGPRVGAKKGGGPRVGAKKGGGGRVVGKGRRGPVVRGGGNVGAAAAGAALGLVIGIIATEAARQQQAVQYCINHYRSYNPQTGIWIDRHGRKHRCP